MGLVATPPAILSIVENGTMNDEAVMNLNVAMEEIVVRSPSPNLLWDSSSFDEINLEYQNMQQQPNSWGITTSISEVFDDDNNNHKCIIDTTILNASADNYVDDDAWKEIEELDF